MSAAPQPRRRRVSAPPRFQASLPTALLLLLACPWLAGCRFDGAGVDLPDAQSCGNDFREPPEECDGQDLGGSTCASLTEYIHGMPSCTDACTIDVSGCHTCGNEVREEAEVCDGADLGESDCRSLGHSGGRLGCTADCNSYDDSQCVDLPPDWYDAGWTRRRRIVVPAGAASADLPAFPLLVVLTDPTLGSKTHPAGNDFLFTAEDGVTKLAHEVETFDGLAGELVSWVNVPLLSSGDDTTIYLYYGNPNAQAQAAAELVWGDDYQGVWHLAEPASDEQNAALHRDSTGNENHGLQHGNNQARGSVGYGQRFDGDDDEIEIANPDTFQLGDTSCTISAWIRTTSIQASGIVVKSPVDSHVPDDKLFGINHTADKLGVDQGWVDYLGGVTDVDNGEWHQVVWIQHGDYADSAELWELFVDGAWESSLEAETGADIAGHTLRIGGLVVDSYFPQRFRGDIDEVRISRTTRSQAWLAASYANQRDPDAFYTLGSEEQLTN